MVESEPSQYLKRGGLILMGVALGGFAADYLFNIGISRLLPAHAYGDYKVAYAVASLSAVAVLLGGDRAAPRVLAGPIQRGEGRAVWEYLRFFIGLELVLSVLLVAATLLASTLQLGRFDPLHHHALVIAVFAVPLIAAGALLSRTLQSAKYLGMANLPWRVAFPILKLGLMVVAAGLLGGLTSQSAVVMGIVAVMFIVSWQYWIIRRRGLFEAGRQQDFLRPKQWLALSTPMMGALVVAMALRQVDLFLLEILGEEHEVGHFAAVATTAHVLMLVQLTLVGLIAPLIGPAMESGAASSQAMFRHGQRLLMVSVIPLALIIAWAGRPILGLFGPDYTDAHPALLILLFGYALWAVSALAATWLQYGGRGHWVLSVMLAALVLDIGLNIVLIPRYGLTGAALATTIVFSLAAVANGALYWFFLHSPRGMSSPDKSEPEFPRP
ncbi:MAG: polysaccharide biosynthesis C-terminal domain-containing protein [Gammaproteobacteria bacterium]|nr:polysaccharide biosynthesis C-terminal domain-containing protein [Gammaproteobacteria bacterium]